MSDIPKNFEHETIARLIKEQASKSSTVDGTSVSKTNITIEQAIKGLEFLQKQQQNCDPFAQIGLAKAVSPSSID